MGRTRVCAVCGAGLPRAGPARRRYCSDACRALAYRDRQTSGRIIAVGMLTAEAEIAGDIEALARLLCPECGQPVLPGGRRRRDARYCSGTCRTRAWRHHRLPLEQQEERRQWP
ncbi:zinc finger MYND domain-containing protein [Streptomyces sp. TRM75563]|uniref:zinc finger MYND domain-containing protein n=1 Tax=Streptomyces sp. TRM75563 TaxID=2817418 RepID=UPI001F625A8A|nr:zinc finger MYND domain-containing protein [Streptomyces sp. TRM75563]MCI4041771.1 zinc finger MYND domain-containing protein [Streptomyces sp. TRM75563]